jgi:hypothetical protein
MGKESCEEGDIAGGSPSHSMDEMEKQSNIPFCTASLPAVSSAFEASFGRLVKTTDAAMVRGASVVSSSSGILSFGDWDIV